MTPVPSTDPLHTRAHESEPLSLMVHSLPTPEHPTLANAQLVGRWKVLALLVVCSLPVFAAYWVYFVVRPSGQASLGELIQPVRAMPSFLATDLDGKPRALERLKGQWLLVSVAGGQCEQACQRRLFLQRQLRLMLGKDQDRVDWVWLIHDAVPVSHPLRAHVGDGTVFNVPPAIPQAWLPVAAGKSLADYIFVVDPLGNTMMRFPAQMDSASASRAKRDLERLLRASASWDGPGR